MPITMLARSTLTAACGLLVGFVGARLVLALSDQVDPTSGVFRVVGAYLAWFLIALVTVFAVRWLMPRLGGRSGTSSS